MLTIYQAKLQTLSYEESNPAKDADNFANLVNDLHDKLKDIQHDRGCSYYIDHNGSLVINNNDTCITLSKSGTISVTVQAM